MGFIKEKKKAETLLVSKEMVMGKELWKTFVQVIVLKDHLYWSRYLCAFFIAAVFDASQSYQDRNR